MSKSISFFVLIAFSLSAPTAWANNDADFPSACEMGNDDMQQRHIEKFERFSLGTLNSMADSCAFGDQIQGMIDGAMSSVFGQLSDALRFDDEDFFCGFGTRDVWQQATNHQGANSTYSLNGWTNEHLGRARREIGDYQREYTFGSSRDEPGANNNVFESLFGGGNANSGSDPDDDNSGFF